MLTPQIESWSTVRRFTPGRRAYAVRKIQQLLLALGYADLAARCEGLISAELTQLETLRLFRMAQGSSTATWTPEIIATDVEVDRLVGDLAELLGALARRTGTPRGDAAKKLDDAAFSEGTAYYTQQNFGEEEVRVAGLVALLARHPAEVALTTADDIVAELTVAHLKYQGLILAHEKAARMGYDQVKATDLANQREFLELINAIFTRTGEAPVADRPALRAKLLAPVIEHDQAITELIRARRRVKDVHPETGQPEE